MRCLVGQGPLRPRSSHKINPIESLQTCTNMLSQQVNSYRHTSQCQPRLVHSPSIARPARMLKRNMDLLDFETHKKQTTKFFPRPIRTNGITLTNRFDILRKFYNENKKAEIGNSLPNTNRPRPLNRSNQAYVNKSKENKRQSPSPSLTKKI